MDFEKWFLRNGFGVEVKENYRKWYAKGVEANVYSQLAQVFSHIS